MKIAIIGCGKQAPKHIEGFMANGCTDFVCNDVAASAAQSLAQRFGARVVEDLDELFGDPSIDAIDICTPVRYHEPLIQRAIASGKHFFCEKPLTDSYEKDRRLAEQAAAAGVSGMVGYIYRFAPLIEIGKAVCVEGAIGRIHTAIFRIGGRGSHMRWKHETRNGGGALNEMGVHMIDLAIWYFGPPGHVKLLQSDRRLATRVINGETVDCDAEDWILASMEATGGTQILVQADFVTPAFTQFVELHGEHGSFAGSIDANFSSYIHLGKPWRDYQAGRTNIASQHTDLFARQMGAFLEMIRDGRKADRSTLDDSVNIMKVHHELRGELGSAAPASAAR